MAAILKVVGVKDDENDEYVQVMGVEGGHEYKDTRSANSGSYLSDEDCEIFSIPES